MNDTRSLKEQAIGAVEELQGKLVELSHRIHANPEIGFQEHKAVAWITEMLEGAGFRIERGIGGIPTACLATWGEGHPAVAFLAEYDALPGIGHGCGHNIIAASAVGAALATKAALGEPRGTVALVGTPAEEAGGAKIPLARLGLFNQFDAVMMVHPGLRDSVETESLACVGLEVEFYGRAAHAAAEPEKGINALDALILSYNSINALRQHLRSDARIHGIITNGGDAPNVIPSHTTASFYVRARHEDYLEELKERVLMCFRGAAKATGAGLEHRWSDWRYASLKNNRPMVEAFSANMEALGRRPQPPDPAEGFGSTDTGNVSVVAPTIHPVLAIAHPNTLRHSPEFARAAVSPEGDKGLLDAAKAMAMTAIDIITDTNLARRIMEDFKESLRA
ncbi:MAG: M20 family metallopeptidase [Dehalococcoidia bacterium]|nr:M20 family metallopeptidase [Dehalococcoidia bacterium]